MKKLAYFAFFILLSSSLSAEEIPGVFYSIRPDPYVSSDQVSICRVTVKNESGRTLDGRTLAFEAAALENGIAVVQERGRFGGVVRSGETAETLIGFNGVFREFDVRAAETSSKAKSVRSRGGKGASSAPKSTRRSAGSKRRKTS